MYDGVRCCVDEHRMCCKGRFCRAGAKGFRVLNSTMVRYTLFFGAPTSTPTPVANMQRENVLMMADVNVRMVLANVCVFGECVRRLLSIDANRLGKEFPNSFRRKIVHMHTCLTRSLFLSLTLSRGLIRRNPSMTQLVHRRCWAARSFHILYHPYM